jgi:hypothetical protein
MLDGLFDASALRCRFGKRYERGDVLVLNQHRSVCPLTRHFWYVPHNMVARIIAVCERELELELERVQQVRTRSEHPSLHQQTAYPTKQTPGDWPERFAWPLGPPGARLSEHENHVCIQRQRPRTTRVVQWVRHTGRFIPRKHHGETHQ